jgi:hypothetical protein
MLHLPPGILCRVALDLRVGAAVCVIGTQPVAEQRHLVDLGRADGEHVRVDVGVRCA